MRPAKGIWAGSLAVAGLAGSAAAQPAAGPGCAAPPPCPAPGAVPGLETNVQQPQPQAGATEQGAGASAVGGSRTGFYGGNLTSTGSGLTASASIPTAGAAPGQLGVIAPNTLVVSSGADNARVFTNGGNLNTSQIPLILPGMFTAAVTESALPTDRVFFGYSYYEGFKVVGPAGVTNGFNLNVYDIGVEKTLFGGRGSVYVLAPFLDATDNVSDAPIDGFGDVSAGFKFSLLGDRCTGSALTVGFTAAAPTARPLHVTTGSGLLNPPSTGPTDAINPPGLQALIPNTTEKVNPTFLQPWVAASLGMDRLSIQNYLGLVIPTDDRVATFFNDDIGFSYQFYRADCDRILSSAALTCDVQLLLPINHQGTTAAGVGTAAFPTFTQSIALPPFAAPLSLNLPDQVFVTPGVAVGLGERALLSTGIAVPVAGPKAFDIGVTVGLNLFF